MEQAPFSPCVLASADAARTGRVSGSDVWLRAGSAPRPAGSLPKQPGQPLQG